MTDVSVGVKAKRKRGRPRKDSNVCSLQSAAAAENSSLMKAQGAAELADGGGKIKDDGMAGSMVYGVVEGSFDAGYLISVRIGANLTPFRGVVFQPRKVVAVTPANDVAPQAKMYQRREIQVPVYDHSPKQQQQQQPLLPYNQSSFIAVDEPMLRTGSSSSAMEGKHFPYVQVMQAFEASTAAPSNGADIKETTPHADDAAAAAHVHQLETLAPPPPPQPQPSPFEINNAGESSSPQTLKSSDHHLHYYNEPAGNHDVNFFADANHRESDQLVESISKSPNLKLDLAFTVHKEKQQMAGTDSSIYTVLNGMTTTKNPNIGYHQALVAGNPLLLPPDIMGEPLEFMMERPKTPPNCKNSEEETNMEVQSRLVHGVGGDDGEGASSYKLELATPHTRIADMDFVLSQPTQSNAHGISPCPSHTTNQ